MSEGSYSVLGQLDVGNIPAADVSALFKGLEIARAALEEAVSELARIGFDVDVFKNADDGLGASVVWTMGAKGRKRY